MPEAKFILKEPNSEKETLVYLQYHFNYTKLKWSTSEKIHPKFWNSSKQRAKETKAFTEYAQFNFRLDNIVAAVNNAYRRLINDGIAVNPEILKTELQNNLLIEPVIKDKNGVISFIEDFISQVRKDRTESTISIYNTTKTHLEEYARNRRKKLRFENMTIEFYRDFKEFLYDKEFGINTVGKYIKTIKSFLREAEERGAKIPKDYRSKRFKVDKEDAENIYLTETELQSLYKKAFDKPNLERIRDLFLIGCYTGLRFSDFSQLSVDNLIVDAEGSKMIRIKTKKTGEVVIIPVHSVVEEIFLKYNNQLPSTISNQKMNSYLKDMGKDAEINAFQIKSVSKGNLINKITLERYKLITTHTARRSFATNAYLSGIPSISIMKITGHKTDKAFMKYIKISQEENASKLKDHSFFKKKAE